MAERAASGAPSRFWRHPPPTSSRPASTSGHGGAQLGLADLPAQVEHSVPASNLRFVFIDASVYYVDERGEHSGTLSEPADTQEERCRLQSVSNDEQWLRTAVALGGDLIDLARRSDEGAAWGCASGYYGGSEPGPNRMALAIKRLTGIRPPRPAWGPMRRPAHGRWAVRRVFAYDPGPDTPHVAIWHLGFSENPQWFPRWCEAISTGAAPTAMILPDSPINRDLARRWNAGERLQRRGWHGDGVAHYPGSVAHIRTRVSTVIDVDGTEIPGDSLVGAISFLQTRHQLRVSPFDLLRDPLLSGQIGPVDVEDSEWTSRERTNLAKLQKRYDRPQRIHAWLAKATQAPPIDIFSDGDSYESSVSQVVRTAERALRTGAIAPVLISSWTGWAPSALSRGERPQVPARSGTYGRLVDWYRATFDLAVNDGLIDADWMPVREEWHARAFLEFPGKTTDYYDHIHTAERALQSEQEWVRLMGERETEYSAWYHSVFESATKLGLLVGGEGKMP